MEFSGSALRHYVEYLYKREHLNIDQVSGEQEDEQEKERESFFPQRKHTVPITNSGLNLGVPKYGRLCFSVLELLVRGAFILFLIGF